MNTFNYEKALKKTLVKFEKQKQKDIKKYRMEGYNQDWIDKRKFTWSIKWYPRLKIFKRKARSIVTFDPNTCTGYSYNTCIVRKIKGKVVFNSGHFSNTTSTHQGELKYLLRQLGIKIDVDIYQSQCLTYGVTLHPIYRKISQLEISAARKGARKTTKEENPKIIAGLKQDLKTLRKLGGRIDKTQIEVIHKSELRNEEYRLERVKRKYEQWKLENADVLKKKAYDRSFERLLK